MHLLTYQICRVITHDLIYYYINKITLHESESKLQKKIK